MRTLSPAQLDELVASYDECGFAYVRQMFSTQELAPLVESLDDGAAPGGFSVRDSLGGKQELAVWIELGNDLVGVIPRLEPLVEIATRVVRDDVYHWHSKLSWKRPHATSIWDWHQDFPFWTKEGAALPTMCTIAIAVQPVFEANGCMKFVRGSHRLGALEIIDIGQSQGADPAAVEEALTSHELEACEMEAGDVVIFHSNTLHSSGPNQTDVARPLLMSSYNAVSNAPASPDSPYRQRPLEVVAAGRLTDGCSGVFDATPMIDPTTDGLGQGYTFEPIASSS